MQHERIQEATEIYARFQGSDATISDLSVLKEREDIMTSIKKERHMGQASWTEILTEIKERREKHQPRSSWRRTLLVWASATLGVSVPTNDFLTDSTSGRKLTA